MTAILVGLNYHRIGARDPANPYHRLHTVARPVFEAQIDHARGLGGFVSLGDVAARRLPDGPSFCLTFDDVSDSIDPVRPWLVERGIRFHVCPTTEITRRGHGTRDKVNWIVARLEPATIAEAVTEAFGKDTARRMEAESFYRFTKDAAIPPPVMEERIIAPLFEKAVRGDEAMFDAGAYLDWDDIRLCAAAAEIGIVNHSARHRRMDRMTVDEIEDDIGLAEAAFAEELGWAPRDFAVPFGERQDGLGRRLGRILEARGYRSVLWVGRAANVVDGPGAGPGPLHLSRLHVAPEVEKFRRQVERAIHDATPALSKI